MLLIVMICLAHKIPDTLLASLIMDKNAVSGAVEHEPY